ncbi:MAG: O-antigen ligase family protein [Salibacteraceae bacterium]
MNLFNRHSVFLLQNYLLYAIAFLIPLYPRIVPALIVLFGSLSLFAIIKGYSRVQMSEVSVLMLLLFGLHLIGLLYTENQSRGWFDIEVKLSLMAFPIAFMGFRFLRQTNLKRILQMFVLGTMVASVFCLLNSSYKYFILDLPYYHFITTRFSVIIHPSYFALYIIFSLLIIMRLEWPLVKRTLERTVLNIIILIFFSVVVVLTGSKTGFIMWFILAMWLTVLYVKQSRFKWLPILVLVAVMSLIGVIFQNAPLLQSRIVNILNVVQSDELNPKAIESTAVRALVYSSSLEIISSQDWYGQGTGDFQDRLDEVYLEKKYAHAAEKHLNAHNLFLQTWIALGIPGVMMITGVFILLFYRAWRQKEPILTGFAILFFIISMTESTFNVQAGVVFFSFFVVLLTRRIISH